MNRRMVGLLMGVGMLLSVSRVSAAQAAVAKSLYERLGGEPAITAVIDEFVARASSDPAVNFVRKGKKRTWDPTPENVAKLKKHLVQFVASVAGGPQTYEGKDMAAAHRDMEITDAEFDAIAADLKASLDKFNVPAKEENELLTAVGTLRGSIVEVE